MDAIAPNKSVLAICLADSRPRRSEHRSTRTHGRAIFFKGWSELKFPLQFVRVEPYVIPKQSLTGRNTERVDSRVLQVIYAVEPRESNPDLYVGQQIDVFIKVRTNASNSKQQESR